MNLCGLEERKPVITLSQAQHHVIACHPHGTECGIRKLLDEVQIKIWETLPAAFSLSGGIH